MFGKGKKSLRDQVEDLADKIAPHVENARDQIGPVLADARDKAAPVLADARDKAAPVLADARDKAAPVVSDARDRLVNDVVPMVTAAVAAAGEKSGPARKEAKRRGAAAAAALRGEVDPPKKGSKFKKLLVFGGLAGLGAFVFKKLRGEEESSPWQSSYSPPAPAPAPAPSSVPSSAPSPVPAHVGDPLTDTSFGTSAVGTDDAAGASPDEAAADATAESEPHEVTTPDQPADEVDLSGRADPKG